MKQWITEKQYNELSKDNRLKWHKWAVEKHYTFDEVYPGMEELSGDSIVNFPSIGEMIEFLHDKKEKKLIYVHTQTKEVKTLCNDLWKAVKEVLENE